MRISDWSSDVCSSDLQVGDAEIGKGLDVAAVGRATRQARKNLAAAFDLALQQRDVFRQWIVGRRVAADFLDHHGDGAERRAQFMRRRRRQAAERRDLLFAGQRSEEHTSELQSLMPISYAVFCLKQKTPQ